MAESNVGQGGVQVVEGSTQGTFPQWTGWYYATVANNADPLGLGRIQMNVPQVLGTTLSTWAWALTTAAAAAAVGAGTSAVTGANAAVAVTPPAVGTVVVATFLGGDLSNPAYLILTNNVGTVTTPITTGTGSTAGTGGTTGTGTGTGTGSATPAITTSSLSGGTAGVTYSSTLAASGGTTPYTWSVSAGSLPSWATLNGSTGVISGTPGGSPGTTSFTVTVTDSTGATSSTGLSITVGASSVTPTPTLPGGNSAWTLAFADEFDIAYPTKYGTGANPQVWADHLINGDMFRSNDSGTEVEWYPHGYYGQSVANSILTITAEIQNPKSIDPSVPTPLLPTDSNSGAATCGMVSSHLGFAFTTAYVEIREQHPSQATGYNAASWFITRDNVWPPEIDLDEWSTSAGGPGSVHNGYDSPGGTWQNHYFGSDGNYHTYGLLLTETGMTFYYDGQQSYTASLSGIYPWIMMMNAAVSQGYNSSQYPVQYNIDYVRCWVPNGVPAQPVATSISPSNGYSTGSGIAVSFNTVSGATSYRVTACPTDAFRDGDGPAGESTHRYSATGTTSPITVTGMSTSVQYNFTVAAINASGYSLESLPVGPLIMSLNVTTTSLAAGTIGSAYSQTLAAAGGSGTGYTWSVTTGSLPTWATLNASTGAITGTPATATGTTSFTVTVKDSAGDTATMALSITVASSGSSGPPSGGTGGTSSGLWTQVASETFATNTLSTNFVVYNNGTATAYSSNSWMASQVSINTTTKQLLSNAVGSGGERVGGAYYWTGAGNAAMMQYGAWEIDWFNTLQAGYAPVLLMWPVPDAGNWPIDGEIDFCELGVTTSATTTFTGGSANFHLDTSAGSSRALHFSFAGNIDWSKPHTSRLEWQPSYISVFVDGTEVATTTDTSYIPHTKAMRLTLQQEFYGVSDGSIGSLNAFTTVTGLRAYSSSSSIKYGG